MQIYVNEANEEITPMLRWCAGVLQQRVIVHKCSDVHPHLIVSSKAEWRDVPTVKDS